MTITSAKYIKDCDVNWQPIGDNLAISAVINGKTLTVPLDPSNTDYAEIQKLVDDGKLTIQEAT